MKNSNLTVTLQWQQQQWHQHHQQQPPPNAAPQQQNQHQQGSWDKSSSDASQEDINSAWNVKPEVLVVRKGGLLEGRLDEEVDHKKNVQVAHLKKNHTNQRLNQIGAGGIRECTRTGEKLEPVEHLGGERMALLNGRHLSAPLAPSITLPVFELHCKLNTLST